LRFPLKEDDHDFLPRLWATRRVGWLMEQIRSNGEQKELRDEIVDLGTRYGIVTPYTSYLALEPGAAATENTFSMTDQAVGGARRGGNMNRPPQSAPKVMVAPQKDVAKLSTGAAAVQMSKRARAQQDAMQVERDEEDAPSTVVRSVGGKTFYLREGVWTDAEFKADTGKPETKLTFGSDAYFALLKDKPRLAEFFALGERVVVVYEGRIYRVNAATP
jgi:Ca-activated chloride channel family protein